MFRGEMFCKEVRQVVVGANERDTQRVVFDELADVEVAAGNVLGALVVLRIVGEVAGGLVVGGERHGAERGRADFVGEGLEVNTIFGSLGERHEFSFSAREGDAFLLLGCEVDGGVLPPNEPAGGFSLHHR